MWQGTVRATEHHTSNSSSNLVAPAYHSVLPMAAPFTCGTVVSAILQRKHVQRSPEDVEELTLKRDLRSLQEPVWGLGELGNRDERPFSNEATPQGESERIKRVPRVQGDEEDAAAGGSRTHRPEIGN